MIVIVGCGVSGLTCAAALQDAGYDVEIWTDRQPPHTTSDVAAAFWYPYRAYPPERVERWAALSLRRFLELAAQPSCGIEIVEAFDLARAHLGRPWWADAVPSLRPASEPELPPGFAAGWVFEAPVVDMRRYLPWLMRRVRDRGAAIRQRTLSDLDEAAREHPVVVNCSGLGARFLASDPRVTPIRGQLVHVRNPGLRSVVLDEHGDGEIAYVVPRGEQCVLGGTADEGDDDLRVRPRQRAEILERCAALVPALGDAEIVAETVGLRPGRDAVRLERVSLGADRHLIHDYGHGGAGVTLSWGCALDVVELVEQVLPRSPRLSV